ncbi:LysR family transcriptional regulator [Endozoicomonas sp. 4G]|uniref:LysR family transcriptional regulator n=1 Tax=Endozoicomonas sp. 4G TaxID=2872754 RepID=UPI0020785369|nr:LysR family transcriptional regulator [Endozoicomonas sp. 4G]
MRLRHIEVFHAIYTTGSITNAAKILHVSQPSVSKVLSHAEQQLGFALFERVKGRLIPTREAEILFSEVDKMYQQMRSVKNTAENIRTAGFGTISIGVTPALGFEVVPKAITSFQKEHPNVNVDIQTIDNNDVMQSLLERQCDFVVLFSPNTMAGVIEHHCASSEMVVMYPKPLFPEAPDSLTLADLKHLPFIDIGDSGPLGDLLWTRMHENAVQIHSTIKVQTYFIAARMVAWGSGVCIVDKYTASANLSENVSYASLSPGMAFDVSLVHLESKPLSVAATDFMSCFNQAIT